jgi:chromosome segregation ATPase
MVRAGGRRRCSSRWLLWPAVLLLSGGCTVIPRTQLDECQRLGQTLRSENVRLQDRILTLQNQNRDYADRAVDDARRLAVQDEAIARLQQSVQAYQDDRDRLESAFRQLTSNLKGEALDVDSNRSP